jgi:hypothetical protein
MLMLSAAAVAADGHIQAWWHDQRDSRSPMAGQVQPQLTGHLLGLEVADCAALMRVRGDNEVKCASWIPTKLW